MKPCTLAMTTMGLQFRLERPRACTIICFNVHITAEYFNRNVSICQLLQHIAKSILVCARSRPKMLTKTCNKETCLVSQSFSYINFAVHDYLIEVFLVSHRLITHAKQLLEDKEESLCVRVLQTIKGMMARDIDFGDKVRFGTEIFLRAVFNSQREQTLYPAEDSPTAEREGWVKQKASALAG